MISARRSYSVSLPGRKPLHLGARTLVMGILNVTPDSFADGGLHFNVESAVEAGLRMAQDGVDIIDIGGESTRPGAEPLPEADELRRVIPVIERLAARVDVPISIDTYKSSVGRSAVAAGATIINDISGLLYDPLLAQVAADTGAAIVLMHTRGRSRGMYELATYDDAPAEVVRELHGAISRATSAGVPVESIILDPGLGFAKKAEHSAAVLAQLDTVASLNRPILSGPSRKSFLTAGLGDRPPEAREWGTAAAVTASVLLGAHIVRVHGVREMIDVVRVADLIRNAAGRRIAVSIGITEEVTDGPHGS
jgi:dihydropteroate synthase